MRADFAALLSGRNHHSVGMGSITETATSAPGNSSLRPNTKAPLAVTLKLNGYSTAQFGKCHEVPVWQSSPMGPFDAWPDYSAHGSRFTGKISWVQIDLGDDDHDHYIHPDERLRIAMARQ